MKYFILFLVLLFPRIALGAVAFGGCFTNTGDGTSTLTISNVVTSGSNVVLFASTAWAGVPSTTAGVTWDGAAMTLVNEQSISNRSLSLWVKALGNSPGTHDVVFSFNDAANRVVVAACYFSGVDQTTPVGAAVTSTDYVASPVNITVPTDGLGYDVAYDQGQIPTVVAQTPGAGQIKRAEAWVDSGTSNNTAHFTSTRSSTGTFTWTHPGGEYEGQIGVPINAAAGAATITRRRIVIVQ